MKKILVVDDEDVIRFNLEAFLEDEGYIVYTAETGEEAVEKIRAIKDLDLAIVDMRLPGIDGNRVIIEGLGISFDLKIVIHTGSSEYILPKELVELGLTEANILYKPISKMSLLIDKIDSLLLEESFSF